MTVATAMLPAIAPIGSGARIPIAAAKAATAVASRRPAACRLPVIRLVGGFWPPLMMWSRG